MKLTRLIAVIVAVSSLLAAGSLRDRLLAAGETTMAMAVGETLVLPVNHVERIAVGNSGVADTVLFPNQDNMLVINAKTAGVTTIVIWDEDGQRTYKVVVSNTATRMDSYVYTFKNYGLTSTEYDEEKSKLTTAVDKSSIDNLVSLLTPLIGADGFSLDPFSNRVTIRGSEEGLGAAKRALDDLDKPLGQVMIEARFVDMSKDDLKSLGVSLGAQDGRTSGSATLTGDDSMMVTFDTFTSLARRFNITLDMLNRATLGNTLTNPKIAALDGHTAWILVGEKFPVASRDRDGLVSFSYINTGIVLAVRPRIGEDGSITLWMKPEVSAISGWVGDPNTSSSAAPIVSTREAMSELRVKDGEPIVIGGLKRSGTTVTRSKVPILGDAPLIGNFFRRKSTTKNDSELVIIITPQIIKPGDKSTEAGSVEVAPNDASAVASTVAAEPATAVADDPAPVATPESAPVPAPAPVVETDMPSGK